MPTTTGAALLQRTQALALYRAFLREARQLPTANRRRHVETRARAGFEANRAAVGAEAEFLLAAGEAQLENVHVQRRHLNQLKEEGHLKS